MRCAVSFLSVVILVIGVGIAAFIIIWCTESDSDSDICWKCKEDDTCIPLNKRCNNVNDCSNGSDENAMDCNDMFYSVEFLLRNMECGKGNTVNLSNSTNSTLLRINAEAEYPEGCNKTNKAIFCRDINMTTIPWDKLDLDASSLTLSNVLKVENLTMELVPSDNTIMKLFVDRNIIRSLNTKSICNWDYACWMNFEENAIEHIHYNAFCVLPRLKWLILSKNKLTLKGFRFRGMPKLIDLFLSHNLIEEITDGLFRNLVELVTLNLMDNRIHTIHERAFRYNLQLQEIALSGNRLKQLPPFGFIGQKKLRKLYMGYNPFVSLPGTVFSSLSSLESLKLEGIEFEAIDFDALNLLPRLDYVYLKKFSYCRYIPRVSRCFPFSDGMSSIVNLLAGSSLRWIVWIVALLTLAGNLIVLISRCFLSGRGRILNVFINNLAGADFLMGIYLTILAVKDAEYRNSYNIHAYEWSTSLLCSGIGIIAMISSEVSLLILTLMSVERYLVISDPFSYQKLTLNFARLSMMIIWIFVTCLAVAPAIQWRGKLSFYGSTGLCFPVHLDDAFSIGWQYTSFVIVGLNSLCLIIVAISYSMLFWVIRKTRLSTPIDVKDMEMALRFFLMVFTDCLCWLPIIFLKIYALAGHQVPKELITWVVIFVLPINSTINPYLYTLSMPENRTKLFRRLMPTNATIRRSMNLISLPVVRRHRTTTSTEDSRGTYASNASNAIPGETKILSHRNQLSYQESTASSKFEEHF